MKNLFAFVIALLAVADSLQARSIGCTLFDTDKPQKLYMGQYADNDRDQTGTGMQLQKDGTLYVGDFVNGHFEGYGMLIAGDKGLTKKLPGSTMVVGEWIDGKLNGRGTCYGPDGEIVYRGIFSDNEPVDRYPSSGVTDDHYFSDWSNSRGEYYVGEMFGGKPDGFGIFSLTDGTRSIGRVRAGKRYGVALILAGERDWKLVRYDNKARGFEVITSTSDFDARREQYARAQAKINAELRQSLTQFANEGVQLAANIKTRGKSSQAVSSTYVGGSSASYSTGSTLGSSSKSSAKSSGSTKSKSDDCGSAWMSASRTYSDYETQLTNPGNRASTDLEHRREICKKMKALRLKWTSRGCPINKSPREDEF